MIHKLQIRVPDDKWLRWKEEYYATVKDHRLSWNEWITAAVDQLISKEELHQ